MSEESLDRNRQSSQYGSVETGSGSLHRPRSLSTSNCEPMTEDEPETCPYVKLEPSEVPDGWYNNPRSLGVFDFFCPTDECYLTDGFKNDFALPNPRPVLTSGPYFLIDGGNGRYYLWHDESDFMMELYERNLDNILSTLRSDAGRWGLVRRQIGSLGGAKEIPGPWEGPFSKL